MANDVPYQRVVLLTVQRAEPTCAEFSRARETAGAGITVRADRRIVRARAVLYAGFRDELKERVARGNLRARSAVTLPRGWSKWMSAASSLPPRIACCRCPDAKLSMTAGWM